MCGFVGMAGTQPLAGDDLAVVRQLNGLLTRRGPDDEGFWSSPNVALAFRRLAILDPTPAGHQPMPSSDGRHSLVFNGEIYNFKEIRSRLQASGCVFRSDSDTEVVLSALITWGARALDEFNGMFALAFYDQLERILLLARDPLGIKPLYWLDHPKGIVFSSQYDAVVRHPWCERQRLRADVTALYLRFGYVPSPYGIVERTSQLPAGHAMSWHPEAGISTWEYAPWPDPPDRLVDASEVAGQTHATISKAVQRHLVADVPVGTFLSGGIDSPLVTAASQEHIGSALPAFTIGSEDPMFDEADQARRYGEFLGVRHTVRTITEADALSLLDPVLDAFTEPFGDYSAFPTMLVCRLAREQVTVALSGDGGDELFFGYPRMWTALKWRNIFRLPLTARRVIRKALEPFPALRPPGGTTIGSLGFMYENMHSEFGGAALGRIAPGLGDFPRDFDLYRLEGVPSAHELAQWARRTEVVGHLEKMLIKVDRVSMHESLEVRVPLLDKDLVDLAIGMDPFSCMGNGTGKLPLREALASYVPPQIISQPKRGFGVPLGDWFRSGMAGRFTDRVLEHPVVFSDAFDRQVLRELFDEHRSGADRTQQLWNLLTLQEWADRHLRPMPT